MMRIFYLMFILALAFSSLSTTAAGVSWLLLLVLGVFFWIFNGDALRIEGHSYGDHLGLFAAQIWLAACFLSFLFYLIPTIYWGGPWSERHPQLRLLLGAVAAFLCMQYFPYKKRLANLAMHALSISSICAYGLVVSFSSDSAPTNRIPWMAGLSLLSCLLLVGSYQLRNATFNQRSVWLFGSALILVTAILSGVRGSWPLLIIWPLTLIYLHKIENTLWQKTWRWILSSLVVLLLAGAVAVPVKDNPWSRMKLAIQETGIQRDGSGPVGGTSGGVRVALYAAGIESIVDNFSWLGIGPAEAKALIKKTMDDSGLKNHSYIGHFHSDALHVGVEFGVMGLVGYVIYSFGMLSVFIMSARFKSGKVLRVGVISLSLIHISTGLTNMNFAHNYYPLMLSLVLALMFLNESEDKG
jgi:O-antigen ligase